MTTQFRNDACLGYANPDAQSPFLRTSPCDDAWSIGRWLKQTHRTAPRDIRRSRGDTWHVNGMKVRLNYIQGCTEIERIA